MADYNPKTLVLGKDSNTYSYASGPFYGECSTAAATQTKAVTISEIKELNAGLSVRIKFANAQTYNGQPKLQINSLTATNICRMGTTAAARYEWQAGEIIDLIYDGTNFIILSGSIPTTTYYGGRIKLSAATDSTSTALAATASAVKAAYDLAASKTDNVGTITGVQANGTDVASSGVANIPAASTGAYGVTKLSSATNSTSTALAATASAVKTAYDLANGKISATKANIDTALGVGSGTTKFYREDGTWNVPPDDKLYVIELDTVTNTSGSYTHTTSISNVHDDMKPIQIECSNPDVFKNSIEVTTGDGYITLTCANVSGTSNVTVTVMTALSLL